MPDLLTNGKIEDNTPLTSSKDNAKGFAEEEGLASVSGPPADSNMNTMGKKVFVKPKSDDEVVSSDESILLNENYITDQFGVLYRPVYAGESIDVAGENILIYNNKYYTTEGVGNCQFCKGAGKVTVERLGLKDCPDCDGTGDVQQAQMQQPQQIPNVMGQAQQPMQQEQPQITEPQQEVPQPEEFIEEDDPEEEPEQDTFDSFKDKSEEALATEGDNWITMNGVHIKVEKGQTKKQAIQKFLEDKNDDLEDKDDLISNIQRAGKHHFGDDKGKAPDRITNDELKDWWDKQDPKDRKYGGALYLNDNKNFSDLSPDAQSTVRDKYMDQYKSRQDLHNDLRELREKYPKKPYMDEHPDIYYAETQLRGKPTQLSWALSSAKKTKDNTIAVSDSRDFVKDYDEIFEPTRVDGREDVYVFGGSATNIAQMNRVARMAKKDGLIDKANYQTLMDKAVIDAHPNDNKPIAFKLGKKTYYIAPMNLDYVGESSLATEEFYEDGLCKYCREGKHRGVHMRTGDLQCIHKNCTCSWKDPKYTEALATEEKGPTAKYWKSMSPQQRIFFANVFKDKIEPIANMDWNELNDQQKEDVRRMMGTSVESKATELKSGYIKCPKCPQQFSSAQWALDHLKEVHGGTEADKMTWDGDLEDARKEMKNNLKELSGLGDYGADKESGKTVGFSWQQGKENGNESCGCPKKKAQEANIVKYKDFINTEINVLKKRAKAGEAVGVMYGLPTIQKNGRKIKGTLAYAGVSLNDRIYLPEELAKGHGKTLPLLLNHSSIAGAENELHRLDDDMLNALYNEEDYQVGEVTLTWDPKKLTLFYEGVVEHPFFQKEIDDMNMAVSLGIYYDSNSPKVCDESCYTLIKGAEFREVSLVYHAGFPIATIEAVEAELKERSLRSIQKEGAIDNISQGLSIADNAINTFNDLKNETKEAVAKEELDKLMPTGQPIDVTPKEEPATEELDTLAPMEQTIDVEPKPMVGETVIAPTNFSVRGVMGMTISNSNGVKRYTLDPYHAYETNTIHFQVAPKGGEIFGEGLQLQPEMTTPKEVTKEIEKRPDIKFTSPDEDVMNKLPKK